MSQIHRCTWVGDNELLVSYHDLEWGVAVHDDRLLFEMLNLEGAQAGLSWSTILKKRDNYRKTFDKFEVNKIIKYKNAKVASFMKDKGIVRNRLKIKAVIENAKALMAVQKEFGSFDKYVWAFVHNKSISHKKRKEAIFISDNLSKDLKKRGFKFVGPTICFAFMQAVGLVNDHTPDCFCGK